MLKKDGEFKGCCFVKFQDCESAKKAISFDNEMIKGRNVWISYAKKRKPRYW